MNMGKSYSEVDKMVDTKVDTNFQNPHEYYIYSIMQTGSNPLNSAFSIISATKSFVVPNPLGC